MCSDCKTCSEEVGSRGPGSWVLPRGGVLHSCQTRGSSPFLQGGNARPWGRNVGIICYCLLKKEKIPVCVCIYMYLLMLKDSNRKINQITEPVTCGARRAQVWG